MPTATPPRRTLAVRIGAALGAAAILATTAACGQTAPDLPEPETAAGPEAFTQANVDAWLDATLPEMLEDNGIAGATVAVVGDGQVVTTRGFGLRRHRHAGGEAVPVDPATTLFRAGSVSKVFTATAVMQLVEQRRTRPRRRRRASTSTSNSPRASTTTITLRHLLTHTAGFEERVAGLIGFGDGSPDLRDALADRPAGAGYRPGTTPSYSNYGNSLAGYIVAARERRCRSKSTWSEHIFAPLGIDIVVVPPAAARGPRDRMSNGYARRRRPRRGRSRSSARRPPGRSRSPPTTWPASCSRSSAPSPTGPSCSARDARPDARPRARPRRASARSPAAPRMTLGLLRREPQRALDHRPRRRHQLLPLPPASSTRRRGGDLRLVQQHRRQRPATLAAARRRACRASPTATSRRRPSSRNPLSTTDGHERATPSDRRGHLRLLARHAEHVPATCSTCSAPPSSPRCDDGRLLITPIRAPATAGPVRGDRADGSGVRSAASAPSPCGAEDGEVDRHRQERAFTLLPARAPNAAPGLVLPARRPSRCSSLATAVAWPVGRARFRKRPPPARRAPDRGAHGRVRILVRIGVVCTLLALAGWVARHPAP